MRVVNALSDPERQQRVFAPIRRWSKHLKTLIISLALIVLAAYFDIDGLSQFFYDPGR